ncbi:cytochrome c oxidase subunit 3 [Gilvibacter sediminis]|uniref:cytochrome c oxidase subunit 3 n=1 Tax=Gilvibacter sediminis TaxID=379071 RepID=UPI00234FBD91|nr:cytochrome c oxidase subunit 3 [Gilvibacter sediminis]MDC7996405.1 cytochrome c oxidase subunit 3 [Gilvibacter sediminis]
MTEVEQYELDKARRAKRMMLWFGIISLLMSFAAFTSAFIVSSERDDWIADFQMPNAFFLSTPVIILSSITMWLAVRNIREEKRSQGMLFLVSTFILGVVFASLQYYGFRQITYDLGYYFTGESSNITYTYVFLIAFVHLLHIFAALIALGVVIYKHSKQRYNKDNMLGVELAGTFWHFVDLLWIYLFCFLYFVR